MIQLCPLITFSHVDYIKHPFDHLIPYMGDFVWHIECINARPRSLGNSRFWIFLISESLWNHLTLPYGILSTSFPLHVSMKTLKRFCLLRTNWLSNGLRVDSKLWRRWYGKNSGWWKQLISWWLRNQENSKYVISQRMGPCINALNMPNKIPHIGD